MLFRVFYKLTFQGLQSLQRFHATTLECLSLPILEYFWGLFQEILETTLIDQPQFSSHQSLHHRCHWNHRKMISFSLFQTFSTLFLSNITANKPSPTNLQSTNNKISKIALFKLGTFSEFRVFQFSVFRFFDIGILTVKIPNWYKIIDRIYCIKWKRLLWLFNL